MKFIENEISLNCRSVAQLILNNSYYHSKCRMCQDSKLGENIMFDGVKNCYMECVSEDLSPGLGRSPGGRLTTHSSTLAWWIPMDRGAWWAAVRGLQRVGQDQETKPLPPWTWKGGNTKYNRLTDLNKRKLCYWTEFSVDEYKQSRGSPSH